MDEHDKPQLDSDLLAVAISNILQVQTGGRAEAETNEQLRKIVFQLEDITQTLMNQEDDEPQPDG